MVVVWLPISLVLNVMSHSLIPTGDCGQRFVFDGKVNSMDSTTVL